MSLLLDALKEAENQARRPAPAPRVAPANVQPASPASSQSPASASALSLSLSPTSTQAGPELPDASVDAVLEGPGTLSLAEDAAPAAAPLPSELPLPPPRRSSARSGTQPSAPAVQRPVRASVTTRRPALRSVAIAVLLAAVLGGGAVFFLSGGVAGLTGTSEPTATRGSQGTGTALPTDSFPAPGAAAQAVADTADVPATPAAPVPGPALPDAAPAADSRVRPADASASASVTEAGLIDAAVPTWNARAAAPTPAAAQRPVAARAPSQASAPAQPASALVIENRPSPLTAAHVALRAGDLARAETLYRDTLSTEPDQPDALLGLALIAQSRGADQVALGHYRAVLTRRPEDPQAWAGLADLVGEGERDAMESRLRGLLAAHPDPALHFALGNLLARQARWADAQESYFAASTSAPQNADYAFNVAVALDRLGKARAAATLYARALALAADARAVQFDVSAARARLARIEAGSP